MEEATVIMTGLNSDRIINAITHLTTNNSNKTKVRLVTDYSIPNVSEKVVRIVISYINYINQNVWKKEV